MWFNKVIYNSFIFLNNLNYYSQMSYFFSPPFVVYFSFSSSLLIRIVLMIIWIPVGNVLLLRNNLNLSPDIAEVSQEKLLSLVAERLIDSNSNINVTSCFLGLFWSSLDNYVYLFLCKLILMSLSSCCRIKIRVMLKTNSRTLLMPLIYFHDLQLGLM